MYLSDGGGGDRLVLELLERLRERSPDLARHRPLDDCPRPGRDAVLELREPLDVGSGQQVRAGRGELGGLYEGTAQRRRRIEHASGPAPVLHLPVLVPHQPGCPPRPLPQCRVPGPQISRHHTEHEHPRRRRRRGELGEARQRLAAGSRPPQTLRRR